MVFAQSQWRRTYATLQHRSRLQSRMSNRVAEGRNGWIVRSALRTRVRRRVLKAFRLGCAAVGDADIVVSQPPAAGPTPARYEDLFGRQAGHGRGRLRQPADGGRRRPRQLEVPAGSFHQRGCIWKGKPSGGTPATQTHPPNAQGVPYVARTRRCQRPVRF